MVLSQPGALSQANRMSWRNRNSPARAFPTVPHVTLPSSKLRHLRPLAAEFSCREVLCILLPGKKVTIIHRRRASQPSRIQEKAFANPKVDFMWDSRRRAQRRWNPHLNGCQERQNRRGSRDSGRQKRTVRLASSCSSALPHSELFEGKVTMENGYIVTDDDMKTNIPGVFAAGDIRKKSLRQVV